jgi:hypothetical protein
MSKIEKAGCLLGVFGIFASFEGLTVILGGFVAFGLLAMFLGSFPIFLIAYIVSAFVVNYIVPIGAFIAGKNILQRVVYTLFALACAFVLLMPSSFVTLGGCHAGYDWAHWAMDVSPVVQILNELTHEATFSCASMN